MGRRAAATTAVKATAGRLAQHAFSAFRAKAYFTGRYIRARSKGEHGAKALYGDMGQPADMGIWARRSAICGECTLRDGRRAGLRWRSQSPGHHTRQYVRPDAGGWLRMSRVALPQTQSYGVPSEVNEGKTLNLTPHETYSRTA